VKVKSTSVKVYVTVSSRVLSVPVQVPGPAHVGSKWYNPETLTLQVPKVAIATEEVETVAMFGPGCVLKSKVEGETEAETPVAVEPGPTILVV